MGVTGSLGNTLKQIRRDRGWSQTMLTRYSGVHPGQISRIENGVPCNDETKEKIAKALGKKVKEIWP